MWIKIVTLFALTHCILGGQIYDVTTIYNVTDRCMPTGNCVTGWVHTRTNALGLLLYDGKDKYIVPGDSQMFNITCDSLEEICTWNTKEWYTFTYSDKKIEKEKAYKINNKTLSLSFKSGISGDKYLYFTSVPGSIKNQGNIFLLVFGSSYNSPKLYNCNEHRSYDYYRTQNICGTRVDCTHQVDISLLNYHDDIMTFHTDGNRVNIYKGDKYKILMYSWSGSLAKYWSMSGDNFDKFRPSVQVKGLTPVEGKEIVSPLFTPESKQLCLVLVVYSNLDIDSDVLHVFAQDVFNNKHIIQRISNFQAGFNVKHVNITLESNITSPINLVLKKVGSQTVSIFRISSCSPEEEDVELPDVITSYNTSLLRWQLPVYRPAFGYREIAKENFTENLDIVDGVWKNIGSDASNSKNDSCFNGGVWTNEGCSCPPGFSGDDCTSGCGRNRLGQDCGGLCSLHPQECKGLLLCTEKIGCLCAPGYTGQNCREECSPRWYGNSCLQKCGHCVSGLPCDMYTGECTACEPGFLLPFCKKAYVYYGSIPQLSSPDYGVITVSFDPSNYITADGKPELYQVQYKEKASQWRIFTSKTIKSDDVDESEPRNNITETIEGLKTGTHYNVRVLLMDANFNKYDGELVQVSQILTKCDIPDSYDYNVTYVSNSTSFEFSWKYVNDSLHWCPLEGFEVSWKEGRKWLTNEIHQTQFGQETHILGDFLPRSKIRLRVRAVTTGGYAPFSKIVWASTRHEGTSAVRNLRILSSRSTAIGISWDPPKDSDGRHLQYTVTYKCLDQPACSPGCNDATEGHVTVAETSLTLSPLLPFARYIVSVTPEDGLESSFYVGTSKSMPTEVPKLKAQTAIRTNTSLTVFWDDVPVCSSFLLGYNYQLVKKSDALKVLFSGLTKDTSISFHNLTASTDYIVKVFVVTTAGWNPESYLAFNVSTSATVPEAVRNLTIYKRGRSMLGLRWSEPRAIYGKLKSFTITHTLGQAVTTHTIEPTSCTVWPNLYCHTIEGLKSNKKYNVSVSARNVEVPEDGERAEVVGVTKESSPTAPENLKIVNTSSTCVGLQWMYPNLANGIVRTFVVSVEETEQYDQESCCQVYPLVETSVKEEAQLYEAEVSGLHPASTYFVSVSAKTVGLGPPQSLVVYTRPPHLPFTALPQLELCVDEELTWQSQERLPEVNNSVIYSSLIKAHLLLAVINTTLPPTEVIASGVFNKELSSLLQQMIDRPFFFVTEYNQTQGLVKCHFYNQDISSFFNQFGETVSLEFDESESDWGQPSSLTSGQQYQLIAVQVTEYSGVYNADLRYSSAFSLP